MWVSTKIGKVWAKKEVDLDILNQHSVLKFMFGQLYGEKESWGFRYIGKILMEINTFKS